MHRVMPAIKEIPGSFQAFWTAPDSDSVTIAWLGQAGFVLRWNDVRIIVDPYLSNSLEAKYANTDKPHARMTPIPVAPETLAPVDYTLITHRHTDHLDAATLVPLADANPGCVFVLPKAELAHAIDKGLPEMRLMPVTANEVHLPFEDYPDISLHVIPAAHENLEMDADGNHHFIGYILCMAGITIYHSGDTVPFPGLIEALRDFEIDIALLPVNGRGKGVAGNFTFEETVDLCAKLGIPHLVPHHFEMFAFNTVDRTQLAAKATAVTTPRCALPRLDHYFQLTTD